MKTKSLFPKEAWQNSKASPCYDCGSTIKNHHTTLCDLAPKKAIRDLPSKPGTQWWTGKRPSKVKRTKRMFLVACYGKITSDTAPNVSHIVISFEHKPTSFVCRGLLKEINTLVNNYFAFVDAK